ncbi:MAG: hypothetical protein AB1467_05895 [Candidatus Diapherotrites archaeon]
MNLLILVSAVFVIISFFMISLSNVMLESVASSYIKQKEKDVYNIAVVSQSLCETNTFYLQNSIETNPSNAFSRGLYYAMVIKSLPLDSGLNRIIFQIFPRTDLTHLIAADSFDVNAEIRFFDCTTGTCSEASQIKLDPQDIDSENHRINAFVLVKEVVGGKKILYFIPCSTQGKVCLANFGKAGPFNCELYSVS